MSLRVIDRYGRLEWAIPYAGKEPGEFYLDDLTPDQAKELLPELIRDFDERLRRLEEKE